MNVEMACDMFINVTMSLDDSLYDWNTDSFVESKHVIVLDIDPWHRQKNDECRNLLRLPVEMWAYIVTADGTVRRISNSALHRLSRKVTCSTI